MRRRQFVGNHTFRIVIGAAARNHYVVIAQPFVEGVHSNECPNCMSNLKTNYLQLVDVDMQILSCGQRNDLWLFRRVKTRMCNVVIEKHNSFSASY